MNDRLSIIVPSQTINRKKNLRTFWKKITSLPDLVESVNRTVMVPYELIIVVNGENDLRLLEYVRKSTSIKYCINYINVGVARAWNIGRQLAEGEYLLYINDDVTLGIGAIDKMFAYLHEHPNVGVVGPRGAVWEQGEHKYYIESNRPEEASAISGFCFMIPSKIFDNVGGFDVYYTPAGMEEIDFCFRVRAVNHSCVVLPNLNVYTEPSHGISAQKTNIRYFNTQINTVDLHKRNKEYFLQKWSNKN